MTYRQRRRERAFVRGYRGTIRVARDVLPIASKALAVATATKALLNVEKKFWDTQYNVNYTNVAPYIDCLNQVPQGDTGSDRDGAQIKMTKLYWKGTIRNNDQTAPHVHRMSIILDRQSDGVVPTDAQLHQLISEPRSPMNMDNRMRFKVLHDEFLFLEAASAAGQGSRDVKICEGYIDLQKVFPKYKGLRAVYNAGGAPVPSSNPIYVCIWSDSGVAVNSTFETYFRLRFVDN